MLVLAFYKTKICLFNKPTLVFCREYDSSNDDERYPRTNKRIIQINREPPDVEERGKQETFHYKLFSFIPNRSIQFCLRNLDRHIEVASKTPLYAQYI